VADLWGGDECSERGGGEAMSVLEPWFPSCPHDTARHAPEPTLSRYLTNPSQTGGRCSVMVDAARSLVEW